MVFRPRGGRSAAGVELRARAGPVAPQATGPVTTALTVTAAGT
ncbi:hypothetical protein [Streptomyces rhizosphaerihabitans]|nr:hypothetical protein [Streptomyces rhizosphaerihabitans]MCT9008859.1 hypothetical protein [Streptomyces rhizosphaerihabitans]